MKKFESNFTTMSVIISVFINIIMYDTYIYLKGSYLSKFLNQWVVSLFLYFFKYH